MSKTQGTNLRVVLYEGPGSAALSPEDRYRAISALLEDGFDVTRPAPGEGSAGVESAPVLVLGVSGADDPPPAARLEGDGNVHFRDISRLGAEQVVKVAREVREQTGARKLGAWKAWFPVIDHDRCTNCMQCLTFCLFDVYAVDGDKKITVQNESNCKTGCPACSRVCPEVAILFPKYGTGPISGQAVGKEDVARDAVKVDVSGLLGGDLYGSLRARTRAKRRRFSTERDEARALLERKRCLARLGRDAGIPDEVLMWLPTAEEIRERTERARAKPAEPAPTQDDWGI